MNIPITDKIITIDSFKYVLFVNDNNANKPYGWCDREKDILYMMNHFSDVLMKEVEEVGCNVYREKFIINGIEGCRILKQRLGVVYNGAIKVKYTLSYEKIPRYAKGCEIPLPKTILSKSITKID